MTITPSRRYVPKGYTTGTTYACGDHPTCMEMGVSSAEFAKRPGIVWSQFRVIPTGEKRAPKKGEWYLSGSTVAGYRAGGDLPSDYMIAKLVRVERVPAVESYRVLA